MLILETTFGTKIIKFEDFLKVINSSFNPKIQDIEYEKKNYIIKEIFETGGDIARNHIIINNVKQISTIKIKGWNCQIEIISEKHNYGIYDV